MSRSTLPVTPGAGASLLVEDESSSKAPVYFSHQGRLIPVAAAGSDSILTVTDGADVNLVSHKPSGATYARLMLSEEGGDLSFWDDGKGPFADGEGMVLKAGDWYDVANLGELTEFKMCATGATDALVRVLYYKTS